MAPLPNLAPSLTCRPLQLADAQAVADVIIAEEIADLGTASLDATDVLSFWERPSFDLASSTVGVFDGQRLVAYGELVDGVFGAAAVLPSHRRRGIGTALSVWMRGVARKRGLAQIGTHVAQGSPGDHLLASLGYMAGYTAWDLALPAHGALVPSVAPAGYTLRAAAANDLEDCWTVIEDAFLEWAVRDRRPFADWMATTAGRTDHEPWKLRVAVDPAGEIVAAAVIHLSGNTALIDQLATRADQRGQGLASALITDAVTTSTAHGATAWTISTDTRSGARTLYERVGMQVTSTWINRVASLR